MLSRFSLNTLRMCDFGDKVDRYATHNQPPVQQDHDGGGIQGTFNDGYAVAPRPTVFFVERPKRRVPTTHRKGTVLLTQRVRNVQGEGGIANEDLAFAEGVQNRVGERAVAQVSLLSRRVNAMSKLLVENPWNTLVSSHMASACKVYATSPLQLLPMRTTPLSMWAITSRHARRSSG